MLVEIAQLRNRLIKKAEHLGEVQFQANSQLQKVCIPLRFIALKNHDVFRFVTFSGSEKPLSFRIFHVLGTTFSGSQKP